MVAKISSNNSLFGTLLYNKKKIDKGEAKLLSSHNVYERADGSFSMQTTIKSFEPYLIANQKTEKPIFHVSINPSPKDQLSEEQYKKIADQYMKEMGYGNQPYVVFKHTDIQRVHLHIVSIRVDENGKKLDHNFENMRSMKICRQLEKDLNLHPATKQEHKQSYSFPTKPLGYQAGDVKQQINNITKSILNNYDFQSLGEYRTLLELFNVSVEEIKGLKNGKLYHGLTYSAMTENPTTMKKEKIGTPFKSSLFGKSINLPTLEKHYQKSKNTLEKKNTKNKLKPIIRSAMQETTDINLFRQYLLEQNIACVFRQNDEEKIYGVSFIDFENKVILNGSRLGKEFSANIFNDLFKGETLSESDKIPSLILDKLPLNKPTLNNKYQTNMTIMTLSKNKTQANKYKQQRNKGRSL